MVDRLVYESKKSKVFRRQEDGSSMVTAVKVLNYEFPTPADIAQFHNEFDIISGLKLPGIARPHEVPRGLPRRSLPPRGHVLRGSGRGASFSSHGRKGHGAGAPCTDSRAAAAAKSKSTRRALGHCRQAVGEGPRRSIP